MEPAAPVQLLPRDEWPAAGAPRERRRTALAPGTPPTLPPAIDVHGTVRRAAGASASGGPARLGVNSVPGARAGARERRGVRAGGASSRTAAASCSKRKALGSMDSLPSWMGGRLGRMARGSSSMEAKEQRLGEGSSGWCEGSFGWEGNSSNMEGGAASMKTRSSGWNVTSWSMNGATSAMKAHSSPMNPFSCG